MGQQKDLNYEHELPNLVFSFSMFSVCICLFAWNRITTNYFNRSIFLFFFFEHFGCIIKPPVNLKCYCLSVKSITLFCSLA